MINKGGGVSLGAELRAWYDASIYASKNAFTKTPAASRSKQIADEDWIGMAIDLAETYEGQFGKITDAQMREGIEMLKGMLP